MAIRAANPVDGIAPTAGSARISSVTRRALPVAASAFGTGSARALRIAAALPAAVVAADGGSAAGVVPLLVVDVIDAGAAVSGSAELPASWHPAFVVPTRATAPATHPLVSRLMVADTTTGRIHFELPHTALAWNSPLNKIGALTATLPIEDSLESIYEQGASDPRVALRQVLTGPYRYSLIAVYGSGAVFGGPLKPVEGDEEDSKVAVGAAGLEHIFEKRVIVKQGGNAPLTHTSRDVNILGSNVRNAIRQLFLEAVSTYAGGPPKALPMAFPTVDAVGTEDFRYPAYDLKPAWTAITDLIKRVDGPDIRLDPFLYETGNGLFVGWNLEIGNPTFGAGAGPIGPDGPLPWTWNDDMCPITPSTDGVGMATAYFSGGSGQDREKAVGLSTSTRLTSLGFPALEAVDSSSASEADQATVQARADALMAAHDLPRRSWKVEVPVDGIPQLGQFRRGEIARLEVRHKLLIESGDYQRRITDIAHDGGPKATVSCDYEDKLEEVG